MRKKTLNSLIIILICALSIAGGFIYDRVVNDYRMKKYPREYNSEVVSYSYEFGVPVSVIYAMVKVRSDFRPSYVSDAGQIGLFQLTAEQYNKIGDALGERTDSGMLYEPATNLRFGAYWISLLYDKYGNWQCVYAAVYAGEDTVDGWLADISFNNGSGGLISIPDLDTNKYVSTMFKTVDIYKELYE